MKSRILFASAATMLLAACNTNPLEVIVSRCPAVAVVGDTGTWTEFKDETKGKTQDNLAFTASIVELEQFCDEGSRVESELAFKIVAKSYEGYEGATISLPYFVAVLKDNSQLITKQTYEVELQFDSNGLAQMPQAVAVTVPTIDQAREYNYEVLVGFQMDPEKVYYNLVR